MSDRITGVIILALSIWYGWTAGDYEASFGDPLGPAAFPRLLAVPAALLSLCLILFPGPAPEWSRGRALARQLAALAVLIAYALFLENLGFLLATFLAVMLIGRLLGAAWPRAGISALVMAPLLFLLFDKLLGLPLPIYPSLQG